MKIKTISVEVSKTLNVGNYNSIRAMAGAEAIIEPEDILIKKYDELFAMVEDMLNDQLDAMRG